MCYQLGQMGLQIYQPASIWIIIYQLVCPTSWQICTSWQVSNHQHHSSIIELNGWNIMGMCMTSVEWFYLAREGSLNFMIQLWKWSWQLVNLPTSYCDNIPHNSWWNVPDGKRVTLNLAASWKILYIGFFCHGGFLTLSSLSVIITLSLCLLVGEDL